MRLTVLCLFFLWFALPARRVFPQTAVAGHRYYFSKEGDDAGDGSLKHPFASLARCNRLSLESGDSVFFRGGDRFNGQLRVHARGSRLSRIVFLGYGEGKAIIDAGDSSAVIIEDCIYISFSGFSCTGSGRKNGNSEPGISVSHSRYVSLHESEVAGFQKAGLWIFMCDSVSVTNVFAHDNGAAGIEVSGGGEKDACRNIHISRCRAENNPGDPTNLTNHSGNGIVAGFCRSVTIEYCSATNNGWDMPRKGNGPVGIWCFEADSVLIQRCLSYRNKTSAGGGDGGGFDLDGGVTHSLVQYNLSYENQGAGFCLFQYAGASAWHDNLFRYNISENDGYVSEAGASVYVWNSSPDETRFYNAGFQNNTIINQRGPVLSYSDLSRRKGFVFSNNIFISGAAGVKGEPGRDGFTGNDWWSLSGSAPSLPGRNEMPAFRVPAERKPETADSLRAFFGYTLPVNSALYRGGQKTNPISGFSPALSDFNGNRTADRSVGAAFR